MKTAKYWSIKKIGLFFPKRSIELFDENGEKIVGDARWEGDFYCHNNKLTSLEGAPKEVRGSFWCDNNKLTSLKGAPQEVGDSFNCNNNKLTSLKGAPQEVGGGFYCSNNKLTSLEGAPKQNSKNVLQTLFIKHLKRGYVYYDLQIVKLSQFYKDEHKYPKEFVEKVKRSLRQISFENQLLEILNVS